MKAVRQFVVGGSMLVVLALALGFFSPTVVRAVAEKITAVFVTNDPANAIPVNVINAPAGRPASDHVTLVRLAAASGGYREQLANGLSDGEDYSIPAGRVLVITDIDVVFRRGPAGAGLTANYFLTSTDTSSPVSAIRARLQTTLNAEGNGSDNQHLQTGIVFAATNTLGDNMDGSSFDVVVLRGYLADDN